MGAGQATRQGVAQDAKRTAQLMAYGYRVLRVQNEEVETDLEGVLKRIAATCGAEALLPRLDTAGEIKQRKGLRLKRQRCAWKQGQHFEAID